MADSTHAHVLRTSPVPQRLLQTLAFALSLGMIPLAGFAQNDAFQLLVRPSICVSYDSESPCVMSMQVSWEAPRLADVCLQEAEGEDPLRCWDDALEGRHEVQYADTADVHYRLVDANTRAVLAESEVVVINRDLRDSRKRRRHVWSIL